MFYYYLLLTQRLLKVVTAVNSLYKYIEIIVIKSGA